MKATAWIPLLAAVAVGVVLAIALFRARGAAAAGPVAAERRLAERDARTAELTERIRTREEILSTIGDGIVLFAPDGRVAYANPAARDLLGRRFASAGEVTPESLRAAVAAARVALADPVETTFETGGGRVQGPPLPGGGGGRGGGAPPPPPGPPGGGGPGGGAGASP